MQPSPMQCSLMQYAAYAALDWLALHLKVGSGIDQGWGQVQYLYLVLVLKYIFIST